MNLMHTTRVLVVACLSSVASAAVVNADVNFEKDIRPILSKNCFQCHGPDSESRKGELRLDTKAGMIARNDKLGVVIPGKPENSELYLRITSNDESDRMPPPDSKLSLSDAEIKLLKEWIEQGATWSQHWALRSLAQPELPVVPDDLENWVRNDIDRFVLARLVENSFTPSPEADRRTLIRRVTFDLTGLPPTPEQINAFLSDTSEEPFERVVDRLLASPRYGERWARHWMDAVHYADTHGHDEDAIREHAWPYRDYLIHSFNCDTPYARFVQEQIAGDVLFPNDPQGIVATGMLAAGPWDESSQMGIQDGTTDKEIARYLDRDDMIATVMNTFVSMTVHCARCHHHKFDPIPTEDYYSLQAVFAGVDRVDRPYDLDKHTARKRQELLAEKDTLEQGRVAREMLLDVDLQQRFAEWERSRETSVWQILQADTVDSTGESTATKQPDGSILFSGIRPETDVYTISAHITLPHITAVRLEVMTDESLFHKGPGRQDNGNLHLSEFKLLTTGNDGTMTPVSLHKPIADFDQNGWTIAHALDGNPKTAWGIYPQTGQSHEAIFELKQPIDASGGVTLTVVLEQLHGGGHLIGRPRLSVTGTSNPSASAALTTVPAEISELLSLRRSNLNDEQKSKLAIQLLKVENAGALSALPKQSMVYSVASDFQQKGNFVPAMKPRPVHVLRRGNVLSPIEPATPGSLTCVEGLDAHFRIANVDAEGERRAELALWVSARENVLTWRSIVNRVWLHHFGRGIVNTPNDFGRNGVPPTHPQLLDWLAATFRDSSGSLKQLHRLIVTSAAYRQSSQHNARFAANDAGNLHLWRMNRRRLDAESTRDAILQMSSLVDWKMGGPPVRHFTLSNGVHVTPTLNYDRFDIDSADGRRRSVYRFIFRTVPDPFMEALDCPDASQFTPKRSSSMTSLQALAMLNSRFVVRYSEHIARHLEDGNTGRRNQVRRLFELAFGRPPTEEESRSVAAYADQHGLSNACRVLVNSNEFMFVN
ncbi:MAG: PSD1 and planctomycete cytochrome C domain-containing protein [Planctomycetota bacterium]|nr:PSD1 and planctomycete cytochrome C domain-containing protein [Planctomycetota bacterium]